MTNYPTTYRRRTLADSLSSGVKTGSIFFILFKILDSLAGVIKDIGRVMRRHIYASGRYVWNKHIKKDEDYKYTVQKPGAPWVNPLDEIDWFNMNVDAHTEQTFNFLMEDIQKLGRPLPDAGKQLELKRNLRAFLVKEKQKRTQSGT